MTWPLRSCFWHWLLLELHFIHSVRYQWTISEASMLLGSPLPSWLSLLIFAESNYSLPPWWLPWFKPLSSLTWTNPVTSSLCLFLPFSTADDPNFCILPSHLHTVLWLAQFPQMTWPSSLRKQRIWFLRSIHWLHVLLWNAFLFTGPLLNHVKADMSTTLPTCPSS